MSDDQNKVDGKGTRLAKRLLIIGWDAADWIILDQLFARDKMPHLRKLISNGVRADLRTLEPKLSPILWSSIATGKTCDKHGILNFVEPKPDGDGLRVIQSTTRKTKALWNILSQNGLRTNVISWYASHPAEPIKGHIVSNYLKEGEPASTSGEWPLLVGVVHPDTFAPTIADARQRAKNFPRNSVRKLLPKADQLAGKQAANAVRISQIMAYAMSVESAAHAAMAADDWDMTMIFFEAIDTAGHHFMEFRPPRLPYVSEQEIRLFGEVMDRVYEWHDEALGRLLERAGKDTTVLLLSDHGFHSGPKRPKMRGLSPAKREELESSWHRPFGVLVASGPGIQSGGECGPCSLLDLTPTALALLGLAIGEDMDGRALAEIMDAAATISRVPSWDDIDGDAGLHPSDLRQDPVDSSASIQQLIDLGYLAAMPEDSKARIDLAIRSSRSNLAVSYLSRGRYSEAIPIFEELVAQSPGKSGYEQCLIQCHRGAGSYAKALTIARDLLKREPGSNENSLLLAQALADAGEIAASIEQTSLIEIAVGEKPEFAFGLASLCLAQGRYAESARYAAKLVASDPTETSGHLALSRAELAQGHFEEAAGHALDALEISQAIPEAHHLLGVALAWYGELIDAQKSLELAVQLDPNALESQRFALLVAQALNDERAVEDNRQKIAQILEPSDGRSPILPTGSSAFAAKQGLVLP